MYSFDTPKRIITQVVGVRYALVQFVEGAQRNADPPVELYQLDPQS